MLSHIESLLYIQCICHSLHLYGYELCSFELSEVYCTHLLANYSFNIVYIPVVFVLFLLQTLQMLISVVVNSSLDIFGRQAVRLSQFYRVCILSNKQVFSTSELL